MTLSCFNEAPLIQRGKEIIGEAFQPQIGRFNEAPLIQRGKGDFTDAANALKVLASMRPRLFSGERMQGNMANRIE